MANNLSKEDRMLSIALQMNSASSLAIEHCLDVIAVMTDVKLILLFHCVHIDNLRTAPYNFNGFAFMYQV